MNGKHAIYRVYQALCAGMLPPVSGGEADAGAGGRVYHPDTGIIEDTRDKSGADHHHAGNDPARDDRAASGAV